MTGRRTRPKRVRCRVTAKPAKKRRKITTLYAIGNNREAARLSGIGVDRTMLGVFVASGAMCALAAIVLTVYFASARSDTSIGLEVPVITAVVLGGVNIFGGSRTLGGVLISLMVLAFVQNALGLAGVTPEEQQIVTGAVLIVTLIVFGSAAMLRRREERMRLQDEQRRPLTAMRRIGHQARPGGGESRDRRTAMPRQKLGEVEWRIARRKQPSSPEARAASARRSPVRS